MANRFDEEITVLRSEPPTLGYDRIDDEVWRGIAEVRRAREAAPLMYAARAAAVIGALGFGVLGGGMSAVSVARGPQEISAFSIHTELAPSTLLDHEG